MTATTGNCDKDTNFAGSAWDDGAVPLWGGTGVDSLYGAIQGPILAGDGNLYLFDYRMRLHCVQPDGNLCAVTNVNLAAGDPNVARITDDWGITTGTFSTGLSTAILMELWQNRIYIAVMYGDTVNAGGLDDLVITCWDVATQSKCWPGAVADDSYNLDFGPAEFLQPVHALRHRWKRRRHLFGESDARHVRRITDAAVGCVTTAGVSIAE